MFCYIVKVDSKIIFDFVQKTKNTDHDRYILSKPLEAPVVSLPYTHIAIQVSVKSWMQKILKCFDISASRPNI